MRVNNFIREESVLGCVLGSLSHICPFEDLHTWGEGAVLPLMVQNNPTKCSRNLIFIEDGRRQCSRYYSPIPEMSLFRRCRSRLPAESADSDVSGRKGGLVLRQDSQPGGALGSLLQGSRCAIPETVGATACVLGSSQQQRGHIRGGPTVSAPAG